MDTNSLITVATADSLERTSSPCLADRNIIYESTNSQVLVSRKKFSLVENRTLNKKAAVYFSAYDGL